MTNEKVSGLPELPDYFAFFVGTRKSEDGTMILDLLVDPGPSFTESHGTKEQLYTADQMHQYARDALSAHGLPVVDESTQPAEAVEGCRCQSCGDLYVGDLLVPDEVWEKVAGSERLLCASCLLGRIVDAGIWSAARATNVDAAQGAVATETMISRSDVDDVRKDLWNHWEDSLLPTMDDCRAWALKLSPMLLPQPGENAFDGAEAYADHLQRTTPDTTAVVDDTVYIGANVVFGDDWFTQLFVEGVMFLVPVENKDRGRHILAAKKRHPHPCPDTTAAELLGLVEKVIREADRSITVSQQLRLEVLSTELRTLAGKIKEGGT